VKYTVFPSAPFKNLFYITYQYLAEIEEHLGETITTVEPDMKIPTNEFDGKVMYGKRRKRQGNCFFFQYTYARIFIINL